MLMSVMMTGCNNAENNDPAPMEKSQVPLSRPSVELPEDAGFNKEEIVGLLQSSSDNERVQIIQKILSYSPPRTVYIGAIYPYLTNKNSDVAFYARAYFISVINDETVRNYLKKRSESAAPELEAILLDIISQYKKDDS